MSDDQGEGEAVAGAAVSRRRIFVTMKPEYRDCGCSVALTSGPIGRCAMCSESLTCGGLEI